MFHPWYRVPIILTALGLAGAAVTTGVRYVRTVSDNPRRNGMG